jgi:phosphoribosylanthranilate isomerase
LFRIKICGVTSAKDAQLIALAGADAIGLNFYPESPRYVDPSAADKIAAAISPKLARVGVFVNSSVETIKETADRLQLNWVQLHGNEPPEMIAALAGHSVLKAFRIGADGWDAAQRFLDECRARGAIPSAVLLDAAVPGEYGGTGRTIDWQSVAAARSKLAGLPIVLAGGLTPFNVGEAITTAKPDAVDVASGVESKSGAKDLILIRAFVTAAKKTFDADPP